MSICDKSDNDEKAATRQLFEEHEALYKMVARNLIEIKERLYALEQRDGGLQ